MAEPELMGYAQLADLLQARIESGQYEVCSYLPSQRAIADEFSVNRRTVIRALSRLSQSGWLLSDSTRGAMVMRPNDVRLGAVGLCLDSSLPAHLRAMEPGGSGLIANGISRRLVEEGLSRSVVWCHAREDQVVPGPAVAQKMNLGALAIWPTLPTSPASEHRIRVLSRLMPIVLLDRRIVGLDLDFVGFDDRMAGKVLGRHLIEQGHRYFAFIGWSVPETVHHRLDGLLVALNEANLSLPPQAIFLSRNDGVASEWFAPLLALHPRPTAVVCANDLIAVALMQHLFELGLRVPQDIAVVGVGNTVGAMLDALGLTTIDLPHEDLGYAAADLLVSRLGGHDGHHAPPRERRVPVRLVVRRSCGTDTSRPT